MAAATTILEPGSLPHIALAAVPSVSPAEQVETTRRSGAISFAEQDLEWRFRVADHANVRGAQAQHYGVSGGAVFDDAASWRLHDSLHTWTQAKTVARMRRIDAVLAELDAETAGRLRGIYEPGHWYERLSPALLVAQSSQEPASVVTLTSLLPIATRDGATPRSRVEYDRARASYARGRSKAPDPIATRMAVDRLQMQAHRGAITAAAYKTTRHAITEAQRDAPARTWWFEPAADPSTALLSWVDWLLTPGIAKGKPINLRPPPWFQAARNDCEALRLDLLRRYATAERELRTRSRQARTTSLRGVFRADDPSSP